MNQVTRVMDTKQAAAYIGMSIDFLKKARVAGNGPAFIKIGRKVQYMIADLDTFLDSKTKLFNTVNI